VRDIEVRRPKTLAPTSVIQFKRALQGARFIGLSRRGKYLLFSLQTPNRAGRLRLVGHLGMTGRMYLLPAGASLPRHTAVVLNLGKENFVFEDTRYFGRLTLNDEAVAKLGPEPLDDGFSVEQFAAALKRSAQAIKVKLLDQSLVAGVGNIYASEALFRAGIPPGLASRSLRKPEIERLWTSIRSVLLQAIECGSTVPLNYPGTGKRDGLFYFGGAPGAPNYYEERLLVYDRAGHPCPKCGTPIKRRVQAARSTFYCPSCQRRRL
jgi:formamidopyrimidine-DNA glycosylase